MTSAARWEVTPGWRRDRFEQLGALSTPLEQLLTAGGGSRLELDPATGLNAYGCAPRPRIAALAFGSSTASTLSPQAYAAADALRQELLGAARTGDLDLALAQAMAAIRRGILDVCGAADLADVEVVLTPSGTDGEYVALHLACGGSRQPLVNIVIAPDETGSGVLAAAQGRHFARVAPSGAAVRPDAAIAGFDPDLIQVPTVPIRVSNGQPRAVAEIDAEVTALSSRRSPPAGVAWSMCSPAPRPGCSRRASLPRRSSAPPAAALSTSWSTPVRCGCRRNASAPASRRAGWSW